MACRCYIIHTSFVLLDTPRWPRRYTFCNMESNTSVKPKILSVLLHTYRCGPLIRNVNPYPSKSYQVCTCTSPASAVFLTSYITFSWFPCSADRVSATVFCPNDINPRRLFVICSGQDRALLMYIFCLGIFFVSLLFVSLSLLLTSNDFGCRF